jgi:hypothetical protein
MKVAPSFSFSGDAMKGYTATVIAFLLSLPLYQSHPALMYLGMTLVTLLILAFWTGIIRLEWTNKDQAPK